MKKVYFLQTCDTCKRILKEINLEGFERFEIKTNPLTTSQLDEMYRLEKVMKLCLIKEQKNIKQWG